MKLIGIEEHFLTSDVRDAWNAIDLGATDPSVAFHSGAIESRLFDLAQGRIALMDETGLDVQVLSLTTPALHDLGHDSTEIARRPLKPSILPRDAVSSMPVESACITSRMPGIV